VNPATFPERKLAEVASKIQDGTHFSPRLGGGTFKYITSKNIGRGRLRLDSVETISREEHDKIFRRADTRYGDLLLTKDGANTGNAAINTFDEEISLLSSVAFIRANPSVAFEPFVLQYILSGDGQRQIAEAVAGNAITRLTLAKIKALTIPVPSVMEQRRIGSALAAADESIESLDRLVTKKRAIRQGLVQELLTGRTRLPGFCAPWCEATVADLLDFKNGLNKASGYFGHGTPIVNFMDVLTHPVITADVVNGLVTLTRDEIKRFSALRGDMFFTRTSETVDEVGTAAVLVDDVPEAVFSGFVLRGRPKSTLVNPTFLAYQFQLGQVRKQVTATASYTTRALTNGRALGRVAVRLPSLDEQEAVVGVIAHASAEVAVLERRLEAARAIKQGMMQELLSGRTRLPVEGVVA
jgi:type I restriction enzyme S subunit